MPALERIPLFPLGLVLFPEEQLPLHIFEQRYRTMIRHCLSKDVEFGVVAVEEGKIERVGCSARVRSITREYDDGRFDIETMGERRFRVEAFFEDQPYTTADVTFLDDEGDTVVGADRERLVAQHMKLLELLGETIRPNEYRRTQNLSFRIGAQAGLEVEQRQQLLEMDGEAARIAFLVQHLQDFIPRVQSVQERRDRVRSNGHFH